MFRYEDSINVDIWWKFVQVIYNLNKNHEKTIAALIWKVIDKSRLDYFSQTTKNVGLPNNPFIERKPYTIGKEFNYICFYDLGVTL